MNIEEAKNILKHMAFDEYEWFIETDEGATRIHPNVADNAIKTVLAELDKQEKIINAITVDLANEKDIDELICDTCISHGKCKFNAKLTIEENTKLCSKCIQEYYEKKVSEGSETRERKS